MPPLKIDHVGIAVKSIEEALDFYRDGMGLEEITIEEVPSQKVRVASLPLGESRVELVEAVGPDSPVAKFIEKKGTGIHHIAFEVNDIEAALSQLKGKGCQLIDEVPRMGAHGKKIAFVHPRSTFGVLLELCEEKGR